MKYLRYNKLILIILSAFLLLLPSCVDVPYVVGYKGFTCTSNVQEYAFVSGTNGTITAEIISEKGLKNIYIKTGKWNENGTENFDTIIVKGSPKIYKLNYVFNLPDNANIDNKILFTFEDYSNATIDYTANITTTIDKIAPTISISKPVSPNNKFSPLEKIPFVIKITDNKKIYTAVLTCSALNYTKTFTPVNLTDTVININEQLDITVENNYTFNLKAKDAQGNLSEQNIEVVVEVGSKPAIVNILPNIVGVAGGTLPFKFKVSTDNKHTITNVNVKIAAADVSTSKSFTPNTAIANLEDALNIPVTADMHNNDLILTVTATNNVNEVSEWTGNCSIMKGVYIYGKGIVSKNNIEYSMPMTQITGTNDFIYKTYIEAIGEGLKFWNGSISEDGQHVRTAAPINSWGKFDGSTVKEGLSTDITINNPGYYVISFNPITLTYSVVSDSNVPTIAEEVSMYAQVNSLQYNLGSGWTAANWNFIQLNPYPGNAHRFYIDVKNGGSAWNQAFFGIANQASDKGTMYAIPPGGGWFYSNNAYASSLTKVYTWSANGQLCEKGTTPNGTMFRLIVDTYLMQLGWATIDNYSFPVATSSAVKKHY
jgi:hypothetical protein